MAEEQNFWDDVDEALDWLDGVEDDETHDPLAEKDDEDPDEE